MNFLPLKTDTPKADYVKITSNSLIINLNDGRSITVPLEWFPRLLHSTEKERNNWRLIGKGQGIHWQDIDEDISVEGLLAGRPSCESLESFQKWLNHRQSRLSRYSYTQRKKIKL